MYAYIRMIVLSYSWQVERWLFKAVDKNAICHFLLLFVGMKSGIPHEGHLEPKEMKVYQTFFFSFKTISLGKSNCVDIVTNMYGHCYLHRTILVKSQNQINKSCVIYFCYYYYSIIYELVVYFVSFKYQEVILHWHVHYKGCLSNGKRWWILIGQHLSKEINTGMWIMYLWLYIMLM
jgi:hypothetical protein